MALYLLLFYLLHMWGWHKAQGENLLTKVKWRSQNSQDVGQWQEKRRHMLKEINIFFLPWNIQNKIKLLNFISSHEKIKFFEMHLLCSKHFVYKTNYFYLSSSFLWKQFCHCPGCSDRKKIWSGIKKTLLFWLLREPQKMVWPLSYFWLVPQVTCPAGLTWICLTKVSDYFNYQPASKE